MAGVRLLAENRRQTLDEYLLSHKDNAKLKDYFDWMKENHPDIEPMKWAYYYFRRRELFPKKVVKQTVKKKVVAKKPIKKKYTRKKNNTDNLIDLSELRKKLAEADVSMEEHKLVNDTFTTMRLLDPALSDLHIWAGPDGKVCFELTRVKIVSFVS
jgi:hypothetical protein